MGLLDGLKREHRELLTFGKEMLSLPPGAVIYRRGDPSTIVYSVVTGEVSLKVEGKGGTEIEQKYGPGELFGLAALFPGGQTRLAEATVTKDAILVEFRNDGVAMLMKHFGHEPAAIFMRNVLSAVCAQILHMLAMGGDSTRVVTTRHPEYRLDPSQWVETIESSLPSGILGGLFTKTKYPAGATLSTQGKVPDRFFFLKEGTVHAVQESAGGNSTGRQLAAPTVFGHLSFFARVPQPASITAVTACEAIPFDGKSLDNFLKKNPEEGHELLNALLMLSAFQILEIEYER